MSSLPKKPKKGQPQTPVSQRRKGRVGHGHAAATRTSATAQSRDFPAVTDDEGEEGRKLGHGELLESLDPLELAGDDGDGFLVGHVEDDDGEGKDDTSRDASNVDLVGDDWDRSEAYRLIYQQGSALLPGNLNLAIPKWVLHYFQDSEKALLFAQILYWFGPGKHGTPRASRRDDLGRRALDKTHQDLADEVGMVNARRVEGMLKEFLDDNLLDYDPCHGTGKGRTTRIWLKPEGILAAYRLGCQRAAEAEGRLHDKNGGS